MHAPGSDQGTEGGLHDGIVAACSTWNHAMHLISRHLAWIPAPGYYRSLSLWYVRERRRWHDRVHLKGYTRQCEIIDNLFVDSLDWTRAIGQ